MSTASDRIRAFKLGIDQRQSANRSRTYAPTANESVEIEKEATKSQVDEAPMTKQLMLDRFRRRFEGKMRITSASRGGARTMGIKTTQGNGVFGQGKRSRLSIQHQPDPPTAFSEELFFQTDETHVELSKPGNHGNQEGSATSAAPKSHEYAKSRPKSTTSTRKRHPNHTKRPPSRSMGSKSADINAMEFFVEVSESPKSIQEKEKESQKWSFYGGDQFPSYFGIMRVRLREILANMEGHLSLSSAQSQEIEFLADRLLEQCQDFVKTREEDADRVFEEIQACASNLQELLQMNDDPKSAKDIQVEEGSLIFEKDDLDVVDAEHADDTDMIGIGIGMGEQEPVFLQSMSPPSSSFQNHVHAHAQQPIDVIDIGSPMPSSTPASSSSSSSRSASHRLLKPRRLRY